MTYNEAVEFLYTRLPMFTRIGPAAYKEGLGNIVALCERLGDPHLRYPTIHVAGTNGKGSTSHMMATALQHAGYKTGLYTSPHLKDFRERVRVNGRMISHQGVVDFVSQCKEAFVDIEPSFFEMSTALAFKHFADERVDVAVIETGLGGRLDSTNVIEPVLSVITNIGWDHKDLLGDSLEKIAAEKAGIIKPNVPVVISQTQEKIKHVFVEKANAYHAPILFADESFRFVRGGIENGFHRLTYETQNGLLNVQTDLAGAYQSHNVGGVLAACALLNNSGFVLSDVNIRNALTRVRESTGLRGRWETLRSDPLVIADVAHNEDGLRVVLEQLRSLQKKNLRFVIGFVSDKDIPSILKLFPTKAFYYFCKPNLPRGLDVRLLQETATQSGLSGTPYASVRAAYDAALDDANPDDVIFIGGSTFVVAEAIEQ
ncbi:MAG TPA: folylpolyglutamate synthase/dihydrofolate synthase family protein [Chitinophagales bacterium]|nr:folylpolyglutamate synthase/dihydrofolate synthase family protein [Chitinophagales bacterium]